METETEFKKSKVDGIYLGLSGLGGWLILVQIGIYGTLLITGIKFILTLFRFLI
jgi:hypothetical protein